MSPEAQRIAIAEACGWTDFNSAAHAGAIQYGRRPFSCFDSWELPDYLKDLNAMHEAETFIPNGKEQVYFETLHDVSGNLTFYRSTAAQRAEAFLKTLNLWKQPIQSIPSSPNKLTTYENSRITTEAFGRFG